MKDSDFPELALMREGIEYKFPIRIRKFEVTVRPLTNYEIIKAVAQAGSDFEKLPAQDQIQTTASLLSAQRQLEMAASDGPGEPSKLSMTMMNHMTPDEVTALWAQYLHVVDRVNPAFEEMPLEKLVEMADAVKKNKDPRSLLIDSSISSLIALCLHLSKESQT